MPDDRLRTLRERLQQGGGGQAPAEPDRLRSILDRLPGFTGQETASPIPQQFSAPGVPVPPRTATPTEQIEQLILTARMRQGRPREARSQSGLEATSRGRFVTNAMLLNFGPEIGSRLAQRTLDLTDDERAHLESLMEQEISGRRQEDPGTSLGVEVASGGLATLPIGGPVIAGAKSIPGVVVRGAGVGAGVGAVAGAGDAPPGQRLEGALSGGLMGGAIGATAPLILSATAAGLRGAVNRITGQSTQRNAAERVLRALDAEEMTLDQARQRLNELGVEATLADVSGETRRLGRAVTTEPGRASAQARSVLEARNESQGARILQSIEQRLPTSTSFQGTVDQLVTERAVAARPLYAAAYARDVPFTEDLQRLFNRPAIKRAWETAQELAANEDIVLPEIFIRDAQGALTLQTRVAPTMETVDFIKRALDDIVENSRDQLTGKIVGDRARSVATTRRELLGLVDDLNPDYALARAAYAGPSGSLDALHMGRQFAKGDPEILQRQLDKLTPNDQAFFRMGVAQGIREQVLRTPDGINAARRIAGNELARQRLRSVFPDQQSFDEFIAQMDAETEFFKTSNAVLGGSPTAPRLAEQSQLAAPLADAGMDLATGAPGPGALRSLARALTSQGGAANPEVTTALGKMLFSQGGDLQNVLARLAQQQAGTQGGTEAQALINALAAGGGGSQAPRLR